MNYCAKDEFERHIDALRARPKKRDGFTDYVVLGQTVGRVHMNERGETTYRVMDFICPLCEESFGEEAIHNDDKHLVCPHCGEALD